MKNKGIPRRLLERCALHGGWLPWIALSALVLIVTPLLAGAPDEPLQAIGVILAIFDLAVLSVFGRLVTGQETLGEFEHDALVATQTTIL